MINNDVFSRHSLCRLPKLVAKVYAINTVKGIATCHIWQLKVRDRGKHLRIELVEY